MIHFIHLLFILKFNDSYVLINSLPFQLIKRLQRTMFSPYLKFAVHSSILQRLFSCSPFMTSSLEQHIYCLFIMDLSRHGPRLLDSKRWQTCIDHGCHSVLTLQIPKDNNQVASSASTLQLQCLLYWWHFMWELDFIIISVVQHNLQMSNFILYNCDSFDN